MRLYGFQILATTTMGSKEWFFDFEKIRLCKTVKLGNNKTMTVVGKGNIRVKIKGFNKVISYVYFVRVEE